MEPEEILKDFMVTNPKFVKCPECEENPVIQYLISFKPEFAYSVGCKKSPCDEEFFTMSLKDVEQKRSSFQEWHLHPY